MVQVEAKVRVVRVRSVCGFAGSVPSLGAGLVFGSALAIGAIQASQNPPNYGVQLCAGSVLAALMGYRYYKTSKLMPAGVVCVFSVFIITRIGLKMSGVIGEAPPIPMQIPLPDSTPKTN